jgi:hypothetical protein
MYIHDFLRSNLTPGVHKVHNPKQSSYRIMSSDFHCNPYVSPSISPSHHIRSAPPFHKRDTPQNTHKPRDLPPTGIDTARNYPQPARSTPPWHSNLAGGNSAPVAVICESETRYVCNAWQGNCKVASGLCLGKFLGAAGRGQGKGCGAPRFRASERCGGAAVEMRGGFRLGGADGCEEKGEGGSERHFLSHVRLFWCW